MTFIFAFIGIIVGGMLFQSVGVISGGIIGCLFGYLHDLRQRQDAMEKELTRLRKRFGEEPEVHRDDTATPDNGSLPDLVVNPEVTTTTVEEPPSFVFTEIEHNMTKEEPLSQPFGTRRPSAVEDWLRTIFSGENLLVKLGVVILFFGVSFLVKYAAQHGIFPIEIRLTAAALGGCALLATGWRLRGKRPVYSQVIQGGGVGILYLTTYAAMHLFHLVSADFGFVLLVAICALSAVLAVAQDSRSLAVMGSTGGFLAPELASIGSGNPAMLFGYYAVLNGGILAIARPRAWRELNLLGFVSTFIVSAVWGCRFYRPEFFYTVEPFLVLFFLTYTALPVLYSQRQPAALDGSIDGALVFGTPILAFAFQSALVRQYEYGLAWSALAIGIFYVTLAGRLFRGEPGRMRNMAEAFLALGTVFGTLSIPLAFEERWTSAAWCIEGAALVWVGLRQERRLTRAFGYLLLIGSGAMFLGDNRLLSGAWPVLNSFYIGSLLVSGAALFSARLLDRNKYCLEEYEKYAEPVLFAWGMLWWFGGGLHEVGQHTLSELIFGAALAFVAVSCLVCNLLRQRLDWRLLEWPSLGLLAAMTGFVLLQFLDNTGYPSLHGGWFSWPLAMAVWYLILHSARHRQPQLPAIVHSAPLWLLTVLTAWELSGRIAHHLPGMETWAVCAWGAVPALIVLLIARRGIDLPWPVEGNLAAYLGQGSAPLAVAGWLWLLCANLALAGNPWPLSYLPLVNPLDATTLLVLISLVGWYRAIQHSLPELAQMLTQQAATLSLAATLFVWLNAILLRSIHHWCSVPFTAHALFASLTVQTTLSICWCLLALMLMTIATRRGARSVWFIGAGLLGTVVAKLFLVDLAGHGSVARIISFVVVGLLILLIGWFSPVPPRATEGGAP